MIISPNEVEILPDKSTLDDLLNSGDVAEYAFARRKEVPYEMGIT